MLTVLLSVHARRRGWWWEFLLAGVSVGIGLLMKQSILSFGAVPLALSLWPGESPNGKRFFPFRPLSVGRGIVLVWLPVFIYFTAHDSLTEMAYCIFLHNLQYAGSSTTARILMRLKRRFGQLCLTDFRTGGR